MLNKIRRIGIKISQGIFNIEYFPRYIDIYLFHHLVI